MRKTIIGGILSFIGAVGSISAIVTAANHREIGWSDPPGRLLSATSELGVTPLLVLSILGLGVGLLILAKEYFRKD